MFVVSVCALFVLCLFVLCLRVVCFLFGHIFFGEGEDVGAPHFPKRWAKLEAEGCTKSYTEIVAQACPRPLPPPSDENPHLPRESNLTTERGVCPKGEGGIHTNHRNGESTF